MHVTHELLERAIGLFARYAARRRSCGFDSVCPQERFEFGFRDLFVRILDVAKRSVKLTWPQLFRFEFSGVLCLRNSPMKFRFAWAKHIDSQNRIKIRGGGRLDHKGRGRAERICRAASIRRHRRRLWPYLPRFSTRSTSGSAARQHRRAFSCRIEIRPRPHRSTAHRRTFRGIYSARNSDSKLLHSVFPFHPSFPPPDAACIS